MDLSSFFGMVAMFAFLLMVGLFTLDVVDEINAKLSNTETKFCKVRKEKQDTIILECNK